MGSSALKKGINLKILQIYVLDTTYGWLNMSSLRRIDNDAISQSSHGWKSHAQFEYIPQTAPGDSRTINIQEGNKLVQIFPSP